MSTAKADLRSALEARFGDALALETWSGPGGRSLPLAAPIGDEAWSELLRFARAERVRVLPVGLGSKLELGLVDQVELLASTRSDTDVIDYEPGDGTLTARAGARLGRLAQHIRVGGHRLTPTVPEPERTTLGGALAAGQDGFDRLRYGPIRHQLLGLRMALADGTIVKSGGKLVKNVTGYDVHRLLAGSLGTLAVIVEASLRLYPLPETHVLVRASSGSTNDALTTSRALLALPIRPVAVVARNTGGSGWTIEVVLEGRDDVVTWELARVREVLPVCTTEGGRHDLGAPHLRAMSALERRSGSWPPLTIRTRPSRLADALVIVEGACLAASLRPEIATHPGLALAWVWFGDELPAELGLRLDRELRADGHALRWRGPQRPPGGQDPLRPDVPAPARRTMFNLERALDPDGVFPGLRLDDAP